MSDVEAEYLQPGFDPASLTVPRLRSILVSHDISYPSSAKKPQLIELFNQNIAPQARKILASRARARRTSKGITNAAPEDSLFGGAQSEDLMPPPAAPKTRSPRKASSRVKQEESEEELAVPKTRSRSPVKRTPRVTKHARTSDSDLIAEAPSPVKRSTRKSTRSVTPQIKAEEDVDDILGKADGGAFSSENPFQSGSSPASVGRSSVSRTSADARRSFTPTAKSPRSSSRRFIEESEPEQEDDGIVPPSSKTFEIPVSKLGELRYPPQTPEPEPEPVVDSIEPGEEFTPEEQNELIHEQLTGGQEVARRPAKRQKTGGVGKSPFAVILLTLLGGYATWYRQEKLAVGYCGVGRSANQVVPANVELPSWAVNLVEPQCEPCPAHAYCYNNLETRCEPDYILQPHPLSLGGLVPIPPTCEADSEKARRVMAVADRAVEELRERRAKYECGELSDSTGAPVPTAEIKAEELKRAVAQKRRRGMSEQEFEDLWGAAIGEIEKRDEVTSSVDGADSHLLSSNSLARASLKCTVRRSARLALERHRFAIGLLNVVVAAFFYARYQFRQMQSIKAAVPELVNLTLDRLALQATLHARDEQSVPEGWISIGQLRDDVLRDEHSAWKREKLWSRVRKIVEMNSNVRASQRESRSGEVSRVWEWIGHIGAVPDSARRKSGRVSWGAYGDVNSPVSGSDPGPELVQQKWEESRPIF